MALVCQNCQETFEPKWANHRRRQRFCSLSCSGKFNARGRPGRTKTTKGYIALHLPDHPAASKQGYVMEHRVVMERELGRLLKREEVVHHRNRVKDDNRVENLVVMPKRLHDREPKRPPRLVPCPHCQEPIWIRDRSNLTVKRVDLLLPPPPV